MVDMTKGTGTITIQSYTFQVPQPYELGDELDTEGKVNALNQTLAENLRNNIANKVKEAKANGQWSDELHAQLQEELTRYAETYEFGGRVGGGRDPVESEATRIGRQQIRDALKRKNIPMKSVKKEDFDAAVEKLLAKNPEIRELAKQRVKEAQAAAGSDLAELVSSIPLSEGDEASA